MQIENESSLKYKVNLNNGFTLVRQITKSLQLIQRVQLLEKQQRNFDVFPDSWFLFYSEMPVGQVVVESKNEIINLKPHTAIFLPPLSIIKWKLNPGLIKWSAVRGEVKTPASFGEIPFSLPWYYQEKIESEDKIIEYIEENKKDWRQIPFANNDSKIARAIKASIDGSYTSELNLSEYAENFFLKISNISHAFKTCYGVSCLDYLMRLRINEALKKISYENKSLTDACYEAGFSDYSSFYRQFKNWLTVGPSEIFVRERDSKLDL